MTNGTTFAPAPVYAGMRLFTLSFMALFLELLVIRWVPSEVRLVAYYANLMLISSFLGLGLGAMLAERPWRLIRWLMPCTAALVIVILLFRGRAMPGSTGEARFFSEGVQHALGHVILVLIFVLNTLMFVPIGQEIGRLFRLLPPLRAYTWDLLGSLAGTLLFGAFSVTVFSPLIGFAVIVAIHTLLLGSRQLAFTLVPGIALLTLLAINRNGDATWSAYHFLTVHNAWGEQVYEVEPGISPV